MSNASTTSRATSEDTKSEVGTVHCPVTLTFGDGQTPGLRGASASGSVLNAIVRLQRPTKLRRVAGCDRNRLAVERLSQLGGTQHFGAGAQLPQRPFGVS